MLKDQTQKKTRTLLFPELTPRDVNSTLVLKGIIGGSPKITLQDGNNPKG